MHTQISRTNIRLNPNPTYNINTNNHNKTFNVYHTHNSNTRNSLFPSLLIHIKIQ